MQKVSTSGAGLVSTAILAETGDYEATNCPACGEAGGETIFRESFEGVSIRLVLCSSCGLGYSNPRPSESFKIRRYEAWATKERPWEAEAHYDHRQQLRHFHLYRLVMRVIAQRMPAGRILDVGVGGGLFLIFAGVFASEDHTGINSRYQAEGVAFDPHECRLAKTVSGAPVRMLADLQSVPSAYYDAVTLLNVLEHVNSPRETLREIRRVLRPGGPLIVVSPNNQVAFWRLHHGVGKPQASFACHEHILHFRPQSLVHLLKDAGFERTTLIPPVAAGSYGSILRPPLREWVKYSACRGLDLMSGSRCYLYSELLMIAE